MKAKIPTALLALTLALLPSTVRADGSHSGSSTNLCDEQLVARIVLTATTNAPSGAVGIARLKSETEDGVTETVLRLRLRGLLAGDYLLEITTQSNGVTTTLGQFTVGGDDDDCDDHSHSGHSSSDSSDSDDSDDDSDFDRQGHSERTGHSESRSDDDDDDQGEDNGDGRITQVELLLPSEIDPLDIGQIRVSDMAGTVLLVGDLVTPNPTTTLKFRGLVSITAGEGAPSAQGKAQMQSQIRKGKRTTRFTLVASQVPADATFHVAVNGSSVGTTVRSNRKGRLILKKLPSQQSQIRSVRLMDSQGKSAVSTSF